MSETACSRADRAISRLEDLVKVYVDADEFPGQDFADQAIIAWERDRTAAVELVNDCEQ